MQKNNTQQQINTNTTICGVIGDPIHHSASPSIHNSIYSHYNLNYAYHAFHVTKSNLQNAINSFKTLGIKGINVTIPHKESILEHCTTLDELAKKIGAVNTIVFDKEHIHGYNTDGIGFIYAIKHHCKATLKHKHIAILGAGGTAKAISVACNDEQAKSITIINRTLSKAEQCIAHLNTIESTSTLKALSLNSSESFDALAQADIVINTTSVGLNANCNESPLSSMTWASKKHICYDVIYSPPKTEFLIQGEKNGALCFNGSSMLAGQAMYAFTHFTGKNIPFSYFLNPLLIPEVKK